MNVKKLVNLLKIKFNKSDFYRNVFTLMSGTAVAQIIPIAIAPILSRIYSPEEFGQLALYLSVVQILSVIASGRYELAIVLPKEKKKAVELTILAITISCIFSLLSLGVILFFSKNIAQFLGDSKLEKWLFLVPLSVLMISTFNALNYFNTREKKFNIIALANIYKAAGGNITQLFLGFFKFISGGLIIGQLFSHAFGNIKMLKTFLLNGSTIRLTKISDLKLLAKRYINFPKYSMTGIFFNIAGYNFFSIFISSIYGLSTLGFFSNSYRYLGLPATLIGNAISQVYFEKLTDNYRNKEDILKVFTKTLSKSLIISLAFLVFGLLFIKDIIVIYLGEEWLISGQYAQVLIPLFAVRFVTSSLSVTFIAIEEQKKEFLTHLIIFVTSCLIILVSIIFKYSVLKTIILYSSLLCIIYISILIYLYMLVRKKNKLWK